MQHMHILVRCTLVGYRNLYPMAILWYGRVMAVFLAAEQLAMAEIGEWVWLLEA